MSGLGAFQPKVTAETRGLLRLAMLERLPKQGAIDAESLGKRLSIQRGKSRQNRYRPSFRYVAAGVKVRRLQAIGNPFGRPNWTCRNIHYTPAWKRLASSGPGGGSAAVGAGRRPDRLLRSGRLYQAQMTSRPRSATLQGFAAFLAAGRNSRRPSGLPFRPQCNRPVNLNRVRRLSF